MSIAILGLSAVKGIGSYAAGFLMTDVGQRVVRDLRERLFGHTLRQSAGFFSRQTVGELLSRLTNDIGQTQRAVSETIGDLMRESVTLVVNRANGEVEEVPVTLRIDTEIEVDYYVHGGILPFVLRQLVGSA